MPQIQFSWEDCSGVTVRLVGALKQSHAIADLKAFSAVHQELDTSLRAMSAKPVVNPIDAAIAWLMEEAKRKI
jgi:hypothetical protein